MARQKKLSFLALLWFLFCLFPSFAWSVEVQTLVDNSNELVLQVSLEKVPQTPYTNSKGEVQWGCSMCPLSEDRGGPQRPYFYFQILTTEQLPTVSLEKVQWEERIRGDVFPVPSYGPSGEEISQKNNAKYRDAAKLKADVGPLGRVRGYYVRTIGIPLAKWDEAQKQGSRVRSVNVRIRYPKSSSSVGRNTYEAPIPLWVLNQVKNPVGGSYISSKPKLSSSFFKTGTVASKTSTSSEGMNVLGSSYIRIKVGDNNIASLSEDGVYSLAYSTLESSIANSGASDILQGVPIEKIKMYTGERGELSIVPSDIAKEGTLTEIPIEVIDQGVLGTFDTGDEIRFFMHGTSIWKRLQENAVHSTIPIRYQFENNDFSFENYYFLVLEGSTNGLRLEQKQGPTIAGSGVSSSWSYVRAEKDVDVGHCEESRYDQETGKQWHWYLLDSNACSRGTFSRTFSAGDLPLEEGPLQGYENTSPIYLGLFTTNKQRADKFDVFIDNQEASYVTGFSDFPGAYYQMNQAVQPDINLTQVIWTDVVSTTGTTATNNFRFDGYSVIYKREHTYFSSPFYIFSEGSEKYQLQGDITGLRGLKVVNGNAINKLSIVESAFTDSVEIDEDVQYYFYKDSDVRSVVEEQVTLVNRDSRILTDFTNVTNSSIEYLIIAPDLFLSHAINLKEYRESSSRLRSYNTAVVRLQDIYDSYSSGRRSPIAIRDFLKWGQQGWSTTANPSSELQYVLLFGDGCYNYRQIIRSGGVGGTNFSGQCYLPPYEQDGETTDDFFGYLDSGEVIQSTGRLDLSIGRVPIGSIEEANNFLEKVKAYNDPTHYGFWRNTFLSTADDGLQQGKPNNLDPIRQGHTNDAEIMDSLIRVSEPGKWTDKVYLVDYEPNAFFSKPDAAQDLINKVNRGSLLWNYIGHGAYNVMADEGLFVLDKALPQLANRFQNSVFSAFSCTVGRFEQVDKRGIGEVLLVEQEVGAIASVAATRVSYRTQNINLAERYFGLILQRDSSTGETLPLGDVLMQAKAQSIDISNSERYHLLGEPVAQIRKPNLSVALTQSPDTLKALDCNTLEGTVSGGSGTGFVELRIYGQNTRTVTPRIQVGGSVVNEQVHDKNGNILFSIKVPYTNGTFSAKYLLGRKLPFNDTAAYINIYAWDTQNGMEGSYVKENIPVLGEANTCILTDKKGPNILVTGCNRSQTSLLPFENNVKLPKPYCLEVLVEDSTGGVVLSERPDEGTTIEVFRDLPQGLVPVESPELLRLGEDGFETKTFSWDISSELAPGDYSLKIRAEDGFGNTSSKQLDIEIVDDELFDLYKAFNAPNPMRGSGTCFYFGGVVNASTGDRNIQEQTVVDASIHIYNQSGFLVKKLTGMQPHTSLGIETEASCRSRGAWWDGRDFLGNRLGNGAYFYKLKISRTDFSGGSQSLQKSSKKGTLIISR